VFAAAAAAAAAAAVFAQELNPKLGRARGLDLHSVAARLEQGLYQATGQPLQVGNMQIAL
jgi:hypothetical protein